MTDLLLDLHALQRAVDLGQRAYRLMLWLGDAVERGFVTHEAAHSYVSAPDDSREWVERHYENVPPDARPERADVPDFCNLLATYLEGSLDLVADPGTRTESPSGIFSCPLCTSLMKASHVRTRKTTARDKSRARKMLHDVVRRAALVEGAEMTEAEVEAIVDDRAMREPVALFAYGFDLLRRLGGVSVGPAQLVLWRRFAWNPSGSPKQDFVLTAEAIVGAERIVRSRVRPDPNGS